MKQSSHFKLLFVLLCCLSFLNKSSAQECQFALPSIPFVGTNTMLEKQARDMLAKAADTIVGYPACRVKVVGYCENSKVAQQRSWDRVNAVIKYLVDKEGISETRLIFIYGQEGGNCNLVQLESTMEDGPQTVPAPHPNYSNKPR